MIERTHLRKSGTSSRSPQCIGAPTKYACQFAMSGPRLKMIGTIHHPFAIETTATATWIARTRRAQFTARRRASGRLA